MGDKDGQTKKEKDVDSGKSLSTSIDELFADLGNPGRYQIFIFVLIALNYFPVVFNQLVGAFDSAEVNYTCDALKGSSYLEHNGQNVSVVSRELKQCETFVTLQNGFNQTILCSSGDWLYQTEDRERTIVTEWDLVCGDSFLRPLSTTIYFSGVMIGGLVLGVLSDKFGRRPILLVTLYSPILIGVSVYFANSYIMFVCIRFVAGIFVQSLQMTSYIIAVEMFLPEYRAIAGALLECMWGASVIALGVIAYLIRDWRYIQLAITLPSLLASFYICVIPESIRWMFMNGKLEGAESSVQRIANFNKVTFPSATWRSARHLAERRGPHQHGPRVADLLSNSRIMKRSFILFYIWFAEAAAYYGLTFKVTSLAGNKYLNFFIGASVEMFAHCLNVVLLRRVRRRVTFIGYALLAAAACITAGSLPDESTVLGVDMKLLSTGFAIVGRFAVAGLYSLIYLYTSELFPTVIRNIGMGICGFWTRVGGVIAPQINSLGSTESFSVIIFGVMMFMTALLCLMLPETLGQKLPDTIEDLDRDLSYTEIVITVESNSDTKDKEHTKDVPRKSDPVTKDINNTIDVPKKTDPVYTITNGSISTKL